MLLHHMKKPSGTHQEDFVHQLTLVHQTMDHLLTLLVILCRSMPKMLYKSFHSDLFLPQHDGLGDEYHPLLHHDVALLLLAPGHGQHAQCQTQLPTL